jgi:hypothetical protein
MMEGSQRREERQVMNNNTKDPHGEIKILTHEPVKGWRPVFFALVAVGVLYLVIILARTL